MRARFGWLILFALIALLAVSCEDGNNDNDLFFSGSDPFIQQVYLGNVPIEVGGTFNVPLAYVTSMRFEVGTEVTKASLDQLLDYEIWIENLDTGITALITDCNLAENGELVWVDNTDMVIEYRMIHPMSYILVGGGPQYLGSVGDTFKVTILVMVGQTADGNHFSLVNDTFNIVWTERSQG